MQGEIAGLTKDVWLQDVFESNGGKLNPIHIPDQLGCGRDKLTYEEIDIHMDNDMMNLQKSVIWVSKD